MRRASGLPAAAQVWWAVGYVLVGATIAALAAWPIYQSQRVIIVAVVGALLGMGIAVLSVWRAWSWWLTTLVLAGVYALIVVPVAIPSALTSPIRVLEGIRDGFTGLVLGWKQLVTIELPLGDYQAVLVPLLAVLFVGTWAALTLALKASTASVGAVPVIIAMFTFGVVFGSSALGAPLRLGFVEIPGGALVVLGIAVITASVVWLVGRARIARAEALGRARGSVVGVSQQREQTWPVVRRNALGIGILLVALVVGVAIAPVAASLTERTTLRDGADPYLDVSQVQSPLMTYRAWFSGDRLDAELFTVTDRSEGVDRLRLATLSEFDGARFDLEPNENFVRLANSTISATDVQASITVGAGYAGPWLPLPGITSSAPRFDGARGQALTDGLYVAPGGSTAVVINAADQSVDGALAPGDRVTVAGTPLADAETLAGTQGGDPRIDSEVFQALEEWVDRQELPRTGDGLIEAITRLKDRGYLSHSRADDALSAGWIEALTSRADYTFEASLAGHSTARIESLFASLNDQQVKAGLDATDDLLVSAVGDDEQFAAAAALLARYFGFDSRVVFGVLLDSSVSVPSVLPCTADGVCTGANVTAWVEVQAPNGQWVSIDATPQFVEPMSKVIVGEILPEHPTTPDEPSSEILAPPNSVRADSDEVSQPGQNDVAVRNILEILGWVAMGVGALLLLILPVLVLTGAKVIQRRRRRNEPVPEASIVGAWDELVDRYVDVGLVVDQAETRQQIAAAVGRPAAATVAQAVDLAVFDSAPSTPQAATAVWDIVNVERREIARAVPWRARLKARLNPASFVRHIRLERARRRAAAVSRRSTS